jgi:hypothetical protein
VLAALGRAVHREHRRRGGDDIDDADEGFLWDRGALRAAHREERRASHREGQRIPVGGRALDGMSGQIRDGDTERRHLGQREVHENDAASQHVQTQVDMNAGQDETGEKRKTEDVEHGVARGRLPRNRGGLDEPPHVEVEEREIVAGFRLSPHRRGEDHHARAAPRRHLGDDR